MTKYKKFGIVSDKSEMAESTKKHLVAKYGFQEVEDQSFLKDVDVLITVGGDGFMLQTLRNHIEDGIPIYGINKGTVGFLMNEYSDKDLTDRVNNSRDSKIHPLKAICKCADGKIREAVAVNEISVLRTTGQAAKLQLNIDGTTHLDELVCDGVLLSTPAGSSAYNYSNGGMILPISSNLLSLTPISPFRPRRWRGALLPNKAKVEFNIHKHEKRPVKVVADNQEINGVVSVQVELDTSKTIHLLFDSGHSLEERIMREMFMVC